MSEQGGGALSPHNNHPYNNNAFASKVNGDVHLTELSSSNSTSHLTLLKSAPSTSPTSNNSNSSGLPSLFTFGEGEGLGSRLSDAFSEIRYAELTHWDLALNSISYPGSEVLVGGGGATARLIDSRSLDSTDPYRPWEKPDSNNSAHQSPTSTSTNGGNHSAIVATPIAVHPGPSATPENGISSTNNNSSDKSPTTLTPLTNVFPQFSDSFSQPPQKLALPSFQSQFNPFQEPQTQPPITTSTTTMLDSTPSTTNSSANSLPSFHTLPANRGVAVGVYQHQPNHQFLDERHIQIFPGQVQFGQLISAQQTPLQGQQISLQQQQQSPHHGMNGGITNNANGHQHHQHHHFAPNGNVTFASVPPHQLHQHHPHHHLQHHQGGTIQLQELVGVPHLLHITNGGSGNNGNKGHNSGGMPNTTTTTDGLIIHHHHDGHSSLVVNNQQQHHPGPPPSHININMPKYIHGAGILPPGNEHLHPIETHLIAVNPNMLHSHGHTPQLLQHGGQQLGQNQNGLHHTQQSPITKLEQAQCSPNGMITNGITTPNGTPKRVVNRKRKNAAAGAGMEHQGLIDQQHPQHHQNELDPQVSSVSSTDSDYHHHSHHRGVGRPPGMNSGGGNGLLNGGTPNNGHNGNGLHHPSGGGSGGNCMDVESGLDKPVKKKRKRCGECTGCQRKDNCGDCAPCRNDKSHQICKMRRCDKLTEKKTPKVKLKQQQH